MSVFLTINAKVDAKRIRRETRDGRPHIIIPSKTLPDDIVMNGILYPAQLIAGSFMQLEGAPAPVGHPKVDGMFVSAKSDAGKEQGAIGAWNENPRQEVNAQGKKVVVVDKVIDVNRAKESAIGQRALAAVEAAERNGTPIHTSVGAFLERSEQAGANETGSYQYVANQMLIDHDAILLDEEGAATPAQGTGLFVNAKNYPVKVDVVNSALDESLANDIFHAVDYAIDEVERAERRAGRRTFVEKIMNEIRGFVSQSAGAASPVVNKSSNQEADDMPISEEQFNGLANKVDQLLQANQKQESTIAEQLKTALQPLTDAISGLQANQKAEEEKERAGLVEKIVKAGILDEEDTKDLQVNVLRTMASRINGKGGAKGVNGEFQANSGDEYNVDYDMNKNFEESK